MKTRYLSELIKEISKLSSETEVIDFLKGLLTPVELEQMVLRLQIIKMLKKGIAQHVIASKLGVGVATVTRGSKMLHKGRFKNVE